MTDNSGWISLNGCNACVNTPLCECLGSCAILAVDTVYPENTKRKRRYISILRGATQDPAAVANEIRASLPGTWEEPETTPKAWPQDKEGQYRQTHIVNRTRYRHKSQEKHYRTWEGKVTLTAIERLFIQQLNKPR